jgi:hypothetical protein
MVRADTVKFYAPESGQKRENMKVFPVSFTRGNSGTNHSDAIIVDQVHHEESGDGVKQYSVKMTIDVDAENILIPIAVTEGPKKSAASRLTLSIEETRQLIQHLSQAIKDAEQYVEYLASHKT